MTENSASKKVPQDLLARAFIDILAREAGDVAKPLLRSGEKDDPIERLLDDLSVEAPASHASIRPDLAAAAVLTARAMEGAPGLVRDLRRASPVVSIATFTPDLVVLVADVVEACAFGADCKVQVGRFEPGRYERSALVVARDGTAADHKLEKGNDLVCSAVHAHAPVVGIAADPRRHLPRDLMRAAEHHLVLGQMDAAALSLVLEAVTGTAPTTEIDADLVRAIDVSDLALTVRRDRRPDECLQRLAEIIKNRGLFDAEGPQLEGLAGYGEAKKWGLELAADLAAYRKGQLDWATGCEKGLLLAGPPGVGKTQFAKALAKTAGVPLVATSVADWNAAAYLSGTLQAMRNAFAQARRLAPAILIIDELDGISDRATVRGDYVEYWVQIVNLLLELLAGIEDRPGVVVVGATNHPEKIDPAVRRAGRLDRTIVIEKPDLEDLAAIFRYHLKNDLAGSDLMPLALVANGGTGADVEAWVRRARSKARRARRDLLVDDLLCEIRGARPTMPPSVRHAGAAHEAGHVVVSAALGTVEIKAASVYDLGGTTSIRLKLEHSQTRHGLESLIAVLLGGRAAEELLLAPDAITVGAGGGEDSDLGRATRLAVELETRLGLGDFGLVHVPERSAELMIMRDETLIAAVRRRLDRCHDRARAIVAANRTAAEAVAAALEARGYLDQRQIDALLARHPVRLPAPASPAAGPAPAPSEREPLAGGPSRPGRTGRRRSKDSKGRMR